MRNCPARKEEGGQRWEGEGAEGPPKEGGKCRRRGGAAAEDRQELAAEAVRVRRELAVLLPSSSPSSSPLAEEEEGASRVEEPRQAKPSHLAAQVEAAAVGVGGPTLDGRQVVCARFMLCSFFACYVGTQAGFCRFAGQKYSQKAPLILKRAPRLAGLARGGGASRGHAAKPRSRRKAKIRHHAIGRSEAGEEERVAIQCRPVPARKKGQRQRQSMRTNPWAGRLACCAGHGYWQALCPLLVHHVDQLLEVACLLLLLRRPYPNRTSICITATRPRCRPAHFRRIRW